MERRHALKRLFGATLAVLAFYDEEVYDFLFPETIHGAGNATLESLTSAATGVVGAEGHAAGHATVRGYTLVAEPGGFTLTGGAAAMRVSGASV